MTENEINQQIKELETAESNMTDNPFFAMAKVDLIIEIGRLKDLRKELYGVPR